MRFRRNEIALAQTFAALVLLTACVFVSARYFSASVPRYLLIVVITSMIVAKVRFVVLDFLGLGGRPAPVGRALLVWAATILLLASARALVLGWS